MFPHMKRRLGAWGLTLALIAVLAAAVIPTCADSLCCALSGKTTVQAQMPCCQPSISQRDFDLKPARVEEKQSFRFVATPPPGQAGLPLLHHAADAAPPPEPHPSSPPLFLRNAQFLI